MEKGKEERERGVLDLPLKYMVILPILHRIRDTRVKGETMWPISLFMTIQI